MLKFEFTPCKKNTDIITIIKEYDKFNEAGKACIDLLYKEANKISEAIYPELNKFKLYPKEFYSYDHPEYNQYSLENFIEERLGRNCFVNYRIYCL